MSCDHGDAGDSSLLTPAKRLKSRSFDSSSASIGVPQDFACGLTPTERLKSRSFDSSSASLGVAQDFACGLTPTERLNLTKLFAYFLHKKDVFLR